MCFITINDLFFLQLFLTLFLINLLKILNILSLWYLAGIYLFLLGCVLLFRVDADVFIGFLWVIDLGVGLIFFIFILHFLPFLHLKVYVNIFKLNIVLSLFFFFILFFFSLSTPVDFYFNLFLKKSWIFFISWFNFFNFFCLYSISILNLIRYIYFFNNSFEFFVVNFLLLYAIFNAILLSFFIKSFFSFSALNQFRRFPLLLLPRSTNFIRQQNFIKQQNTSTGSRVWKKSFKNKHL